MTEETYTLAAPAERKKTTAVSLTQLGLKVFRVHPLSKKPEKGWQEAATKNAQLVGKMFDEKPTANIGVLTGGGLLVVDLDMKNGRQGLQSINDLQHERGALPKTLTARTPTGGVHLYFRYDAAHHNVGNRANIADGVDIRGAGGYVLAPGSSLEHGVYAWQDLRPIEPAPQWLLDFVKRDELKQTKGSALSDTPTQILEAKKFLDAHPPAIEGQGGDHHTYITACKMKDFGLSEHAALEILYGGWNQRCEPPWDYGDLETKVHNAFSYGENAQGSATPEVFFEEDDALRRHKAEQAAGADVTARESFKAIEPQPIRTLTPKAIPPRKWVLGSLALEGKVTVLISPGGVGKSTLTLNAALAVATGRQDIMQMRVRVPNGEKPAGAWVFNNEDDEDELHRRVYAAMLHHDIHPDHLLDDVTNAPRLFINSGEHRPFMIAKRVANAAGFAHIPADEAAAIAHIRANNIKLFVVDPFVETHEADENDNVQIAAIGRIYRRIAQQAECAVVLVHHTRKHPSGSAESYVGDQDSGRGAGALTALARIGVTLYGMSEKDAKKYRVDERERWRYVRLDDAKANLSPMRGDAGARWFRRESVDLETSGDDVAESVGVLVALEGAPGGPSSQGAGEADIAAKAASVLSALSRETPLTEVAEILRENELAFADMSLDSLRRKLARAFPDGDTRMPDGSAVRRRTRTGKSGTETVLESVGKSEFE